MRITIAILLTSLFLVSCGTEKKEKKNKTTSKKVPVEKTLLEHVKLAINPKFEDWVLFENGTYIMFDDASQIEDLEKEAIRQMKEFGPVAAGGPAGDFNVINLNKTEGWVVSGHGYGMYTYVNPSELDSSSPNDLTIGLYGRSKRDKDGNNPKIIHVNRSKKS